MSQTFLFHRTSMTTWTPTLALGSPPRNLHQLRDHKQDQALTQLLAKHQSKSLLSKLHHLRNLEWSPSLPHLTLEALMLQCYIHLPRQQQPKGLCQILLYLGSFKLQPNTYHHQRSSIIVLEHHRPPKPRNPWNQTKPKTVSKKYSTISASPANFSAKFTTHSLLTNTSIASAKAWGQEAFLCTYRFGTHWACWCHLHSTIPAEAPLSLILDYLHASDLFNKKQNLEPSRTRMSTHIKALSWISLKLDLPILTSLQSQTVSDFLKSKTRIPFERSEATPIPLAVLAAWENRIIEQMPNQQKLSHLGVSSSLLWLHSDFVTFSGQNHFLLVCKDIFSVAFRGEQKHWYQANHAKFAV